MKRIISALIVTVMLLAMIPVLSVSANTTEGPLKPVYTASSLESMAEPKDEDDDGGVTQLAGYYYDSKGFHMESPTYNKVNTPYTTIATTESYDITKINDTKGNHVLSAKIVVDKYLYNGGTSADQWICFSITDKQNVNPGTAKYQDGWFLLIRGAGNGSYQLQPHLDYDKTFMASNSDFTTGTAEFVDDKEVYEFALDYDGGEWVITINGVDVSADALYIGDQDQTSIFESFKAKAYLNITVQTGYVDEENPDENKIELSVTEFNGEVPYGDDSAEPITDDSSFAPIADSSSIAANMPAVIWDSNKTTFKRYSGSSFEFTDNEDGTVHVVASHGSPYVTWGIKKQISYEAADFPIIAILCKNVPTFDGNFYYCAGDVLAANEDVRTSWDPQEEDYGNGWTLGLVDVDGLWEGRINNLRIGFDAIDYEDEEYNNWDIAFIGCFRSETEAKEYVKTYLGSKGVEVVTEPEATTSAETSATETKPTQETTVAETKALSDDTTAGAKTSETTATGSSTNNSGCGSIVSGIALVAVISLAGISLKKKH